MSFKVGDRVRVIASVEQLVNEGCIPPDQAELLQSGEGTINNLYEGLDDEDPYCSLVHDDPRIGIWYLALTEIKLA